VFEPTLKIGGFGFSKSAAMDSMAKTAVGVRGYMAPEVLISALSDAHRYSLHC
jgi:serine/threonine protein kinase